MADVDFPTRNPKSGGVAVEYCHASRGDSGGHEALTRSAISRKLGMLRGYAFSGQYDAAADYGGPLYFIPDDTIAGLDHARSLGISSEHDLFGGVVPQPFVATKAISHSLVHPGAGAPQGWSAEFGDMVRDAVLPGYTVFTAEDARQACSRLLARGPARLKAVRAKGGHGQTVVSGMAELEAALADVEPAELAGHGLVLEENLRDVTTHSVGQVRVGDLVATYYGTQRLTRDNDGKQVYGGTDLVAVPGGFDRLLTLGLPRAVHDAVVQACHFDAAAEACFPGIILSRRNYDVAQGTGPDGLRRSGVLEQSWRLGGATGAEVAALEIFRTDPGVKTVHAACFEIYGDGCEPPPDATVYFQGHDPKIGPLTKYTVARIDRNGREGP
ncbi:hypothetical protein SAE02_67310 [Skermanella aerolata]|uniref:Biotin carboxylase n=1 Tax=Skermanella aerolata TaxID=393310 RepID=A0A512E1H5_9PROT|nr:biotin carboxylase [Skermanella aerolata KACC 11604]GEO42583.1 hypothetical protein SAE02_67310 [Skermanella aerolata]